MDGIVSKVGHRGEQMWASVLQQSGFYRETGMLEASVHCVRDRTGPGGKAPVAWQCRACTLCPPRRGMITILSVGSLSSFAHPALRQ